MERNIDMFNTKRLMHKEAGIALLDVVLAIAVFAFGMLALVQLQGSLARSSADANQRSVAANIAEEFVEVLRGYRSVLADPDNGVWDYLEMQGNALDGTVSRGGIDYDRAVTITNFWWDEDNQHFVRNLVETPPAGLKLSYPDFKLLRLDVSWGHSEDFYVSSDSSSGTADLGTGSITVYEIIPSSPPSLGADLAIGLAGDSGPLVEYNPGDNPDIVALKLNDKGTRFKESTSAQPKTFHEDKVETWFDVVTYQQKKNPEGDPLTTFLRREQFATISCTCELNTSPSPAEYGYTPTLWTGVAYSEATNVDLKPVGAASKTVSQSEFCEVCCRDHHDLPSGSDEQRYNLSVAGSHPHYDRDGDGNLIGPVEHGDTYVEACRLIRKDGFMRVTQDVSQQTLIGFPEGYLEFDAGVNNYSNYVIEAIEGYYPKQESFLQPNPVTPSLDYTFPARDTASATSLPTATFANEQQLRARSVYTDYLTVAAKTVLANCFPSANADCAAPNALTPLEIYPFFDLQMTWLADWKDEKGNALVDVASDGIKEGDQDGDFMPDYDRGLVSIRSELNKGQAQVSINSYKGNTGLTATQPIYPVSDGLISSLDSLYIDVNESSANAPPIGKVASGDLKEGSKFVKISDLTFESDFAICGKTLTKWSCVVPASGATLIISYDKKKTADICSGLPDRTVIDPLTTTFRLPSEGGAFEILISDTGC